MLKPYINTGFQHFLISYMKLQQVVRLLCHLLCNFLCKVLFLLFDTFTSLKTNELLNSDLRTILFSNLSYILSYALLAILSLNIYLIQKADLFELFLDTTHNHAADDLVVCVRLLVLSCYSQDLFLFCDVICIYFAVVGVQRFQRSRKPRHHSRRKMG